MTDAGEWQQWLGSYAAVRLICTPTIIVDHPVGHRERVSAHLDQRGGLDEPGAPAQQRRRLVSLLAGDAAGGDRS
jgi:hypothetical protein